MNRHLLIRVAAMRRASDIGRDHEVEYVATGVSTYDFNTVEREATRGINLIQHRLSLWGFGVFDIRSKMFSGQLRLHTDLGFNRYIQNRALSLRYRGCPRAHRGERSHHGRLCTSCFPRGAYPGPWGVARSPLVRLAGSTRVGMTLSMKSSTRSPYDFCGSAMAPSVWEALRPGRTRWSASLENLSSLSTTA
jgi:hypothetical protein